MWAVGLRDFVAVDLETTGWDPAADQVIELAAIRFADGQEVAALTTLVDPGRPIASRVQNLTGITPAMVRGKPAPVEAVARLRQFAGNLPLVTHNAEFDLAFLRQCGWSGGGYDTAELARIALPLARSYRLASLARHLGIRLPAQHRAEDDARAAGHLFVHLVNQLYQMEILALQSILRLADPLDWPLKPLLSAVAADRARREGEPRHGPHYWLRAAGDLHGPDPHELREAPDPGPLDVQGLMQLLGPGGPVAEAFPQYEHRPQQLDMLHLVADSFNQGRHLLMEAGTGTGKSLAYLIPAMAWSVKNNERVVVSTHTMNLQEQLLQKDIPFLQAALEGAFDFQAALAKGRGNYLCLRKWEEQSSRADFFFTPEERQFHIRMMAWLGETATGDRAELNLSAAQEEYWSHVLSESETCLGPRCKWFRQHCFAFRARQAARQADVLVVNHSLLLADIAMGGQVLGKYKYLVIDEAHHLEAVATEHLGLQADQRELAAALGFLYRTGRGESPGVLPLLGRRLGVLDERIGGLTEMVTQARQAADDLFRLLAALVRDQGGDGEGESRSLRLTAAALAGPAWRTVPVLRENAALRLNALGQGLSGLCEAIEALQPPPPGREAMVADLGKYAGMMSQYAEAIEEILAAPDPERVYWLELSGRGDWSRVSLRAAPLSVGALLREHLFDQKRAVVMTSATLSVGGSFEHMKRRLGLDAYGPDRLATRAVPSPFRYRDQALLCIPSDVANPRGGEAAFVRAAGEFLAKLLVATQGRTLVLFTSNRMLRQVYQDLKDHLEGEGLTLLAQGQGGSRTHLLEDFKEGGRAVLFGSASFWEGVDVPGEGLSCVVMVRLPFASPGDPVLEARMEDLERRGYSSFQHLSLPQAIIRFKQGFGRLVRTRTDRGAVVVFDNRILPSQTRYGWQFIKSLPGPRVVDAPADEVIRRITDFLQATVEQT